MRKFMLALVASVFFCSAPAPAHAQKPAPPQPLSEVQHDSTLTGKGTTASPLGVANLGIGTDNMKDGAVTAAKVGTAGASAGQVLAADGSGRASWQALATGINPLRVVDSNGNEVGIFSFGYVYGNQNVIRYIASINRYFIFDVGKTAGFIIQPLVRYYQTADCSGEARVEFLSAFENPDDLTTLAVVNDDGYVYYATGNVQEQFTFNSFSHTERTAGQCTNASGTASGYPYGRFPVSDLGSLTPPFKLSR